MADFRGTAQVFVRAQRVLTPAVAETAANAAVPAVIASDPIEVRRSVVLPEMTLQEIDVMLDEIVALIVKKHDGAEER